MKQSYAIHCFDKVSRRTGSFTFDPRQADKDGMFTATSAVFKSVADLFAWANKHKVELAHYQGYDFPAPKASN